jgi:hypothetical protein
MSRAKSRWLPCAGTVATYVGRNRGNQRNVRVIAEVVAGRMVVEAIGKQGIPVRLAVKRKNLKPMQPACSFRDFLRQGL